MSRCIGWPPGQRSCDSIRSGVQASTPVINRGIRHAALDHIERSLDEVGRAERPAPLTRAGAAGQAR